MRLFTGDGKGKTTAALGLAMRAAGRGLRVHIVFFMKGPFPYGETFSLSTLGISFRQFGGLDFVNPGEVKEEEKRWAREALAHAWEAMQSASYDLLILDEVNLAAAWGLLELQEVRQLLEAKPEEMELILTGRYADPGLIAQADLVTEMKKLKHPFDEGLLAQEGIEY